MEFSIVDLLKYNLKNTLLVWEKPKIDYPYNTSGPYNITYITPAPHKAHESTPTT
jgi:hypothetical protein